MSGAHIHHMKVRYMEVDSQGVVFNGWYLTYFDEAVGAYLERTGVPFTRVHEGGHDIHVVHADLDWKRSLTMSEEFTVEVSSSTLGTTSFTIECVARGADGTVACIGRIVYVVVATDGGGKAPIPQLLRDLLA